MLMLMEVPLVCHVHQAIFLKHWVVLRVSLANLANTRISLGHLFAKIAQQARIRMLLEAQVVIHVLLVQSLNQLEVPNAHLAHLDNINLMQVLRFACSALKVHLQILQVNKYAPLV